MRDLAAFALLCCTACSGNAVASREPHAVGQWIWTRADLTPAATAATIHRDRLIWQSVASYVPLHFDVVEDFRRVLVE